MEEKKSIGTKVLAVLVILLILVVVVMSYLLYKNFNEMNEKDDKILEMNERISKLENSNNVNMQEENKTSSKLELGTYEVQEDSSLYDPGYSYEDVNITFLENNEFEATLDMEAMLIKGTYEVSDNNIRCTLKEFTSEYSPRQDIEGFISFEITRNDMIQVKSSSESIIIYVVDIVNKTLTDEQKELSIAPYIEKMTFKLDK